MKAPLMTPRRRSCLSNEGATSTKADAPASVLLVEDDPFARRAIANTLRREGLQVLEEGSVTDALGRVDELAASLDAMVLDYYFGEGCCGDVVNAYRKAGSCCGVLVLSGFLAEGAAAARSVGADDFLLKPAHQELLPRLRRVVRMARWRRGWGTGAVAGPPAERLDLSAEGQLVPSQGMLERESRSVVEGAIRSLLRELAGTGGLVPGTRVAQVLVLSLLGYSRAEMSFVLGIHLSTIRESIEVMRRRLGMRGLHDGIRAAAAAAKCRLADLVREWVVDEEVLARLEAAGRKAS